MTLRKNGESSNSHPRLGAWGRHDPGQCPQGEAVPADPSQTTISPEAFLDQGLRAASMGDIEMLRAIELRNLDLVEQAAWEGWERSKAIVVNNNRSGGQAFQVPTGDPRFLSQINRCIARRSALLNLNKPSKPRDSIWVEAKSARDLRTSLEDLRQKLLTGPLPNHFAPGESESE